MQRLTPYRRVQLAAFALLAASFALPPPVRARAWVLLALVYLGLVAWGVISIRSPFFGRALCELPDSPGVALTYDDGPNPASTPALLDLLAERGVQATFFVVGKEARAQPELLRRIHAEGHVIGNHSERHSPFLNLCFRGPMQREIEACQRTLTDLTGETPRHYRPPVGLRNPAVHPTAAALGLTVVGWSVRSYDRSSEPAQQVVERVLAATHPGAIVLLHDGGLPPERVLAITRGLLDGLDRAGLETCAV